MDKKFLCFLLVVLAGVSLSEARRGKRSADPVYYGYGYGYGYPYYQGYGYYGLGHHYGRHAVGKRSVDADDEASGPYHGYYGYGHGGYYGNYYGYPHYRWYGKRSADEGNELASEEAPVDNKVPVEAEIMKSADDENAAGPHWGGYGYYGYYRPYGYYGHYYGKRSVDDDQETASGPYHGYYGLGGYYGNYYGYGYPRYHYYGKRSADDEPIDDDVPAKVPADGEIMKSGDDQESGPHYGGYYGYYRPYGGYYGYRSWWGKRSADDEVEPEADPTALNKVDDETISDDEEPGSGPSPWGYGRRYGYGRRGYGYGYGRGRYYGR